MQPWSPAKPAGKSREGYIILGVGGADVGVALALSHKGNQVSPASP